MGCGCTRTTKQEFVWYNPANPEGDKPMVYGTEVEAKAKVMRKGGTYVPYDQRLSIEQNIIAAEEERRQLSPN